MNNLNDSIKMLSSYNIPVNCTTLSIQKLMRDVDGNEIDLGVEEYEKRILELIGVEQKFESEVQTKYVYLYSVQELINQNNSFDQVQELDDLVERVLDKSDDFMEKYGNKMICVEKDGKKVVKKKSINGNGGSTKKVKCKKIYDELFGTISRKDMISKWIDDVDMTKNGGSTYYANFGPKGIWRSEIHDDVMVIESEIDVITE